MRKYLRPSQPIPSHAFRYIAFLALATLAASYASAGLEVDSNGRYFVDDGQHVILFGGGLWGVISDPTIDIEAHNDWLERSGGNSNRASLFAFFNAPDVAEGNGLGPWKRTGPGLANDGKEKFDLTQPNPEFWARVNEYFANAREHRIYTLLQIFDEPYIEGGATRWPLHPFNPDNNINTIPGMPASKTMQGTDYGRGAENAFYDPGNKVLMQFQDALVRRLLDETAHYGNIIYEIGNEINMDSSSDKGQAWQQHWVDFFKAYEKEHGVNLLLSNDTSRALMDAHHPDFDVINHHGFLDVFIKGSQPQGLALEIFRRVNEDILKYRKPIINSRPCSDPDRTNYGDVVDIATGRCLFWSYFMGGGQIIGFRTTNESFMGGRSAEVMISHLRRFINATQYWTMDPRGDLIRGAAIGMAQPGRQYALYFPAGGHATVDLSGGGQTYYATWYNPRTGSWNDALEVKGQASQQFTAPDGQDWALYISNRKIGQ